MANCYKRKNGTYSIRVSNGKIAGRQQFIATTYKPPKELNARAAEKAAKEFAEMFELAVRSGRYTPGKKTNEETLSELGITLSDFIERYYYKRIEIRLSPNTVRFYRSVIEQFILPSFGKVRIKDVSSQHLQALIDYLTASGSRYDCENTEPLSPATVKRYATVFSSIMTEAFKMGLAEKDILHKQYIEYPKIYKKEFQAYDIDEVKIFFLELEKAEPKVKALLYTSLLLGLRRGEVIGLMWSDFDFKKGCLQVARSAYKVKGKKQDVKPPKSKSSVRTVYFSDEYAKALLEWRERQKQERNLSGDKWKEQDFVFTNEYGEMMCLYSLGRICSEHEEKCGLRHLKLHGLRHTCGSLMIQNGVDIQTVKSIFGHESIKTTQQYLTAYDHSKKRAADMLVRELLCDEDNK